MRQRSPHPAPTHALSALPTIPCQLLPGTWVGSEVLWAVPHTLQICGGPGLQARGLPRLPPGLQKGLGGQHTTSYRPLRAFLQQRLLTAPTSGCFISLLCPSHCHHPKPSLPSVHQHPHPPNIALSRVTHWSPGSPLPQSMPPWASLRRQKLFAPTLSPCPLLAPVTPDAVLPESSAGKHVFLLDSILSLH